MLLASTSTPISILPPSSSFKSTPSHPTIQLKLSNSILSNLISTHAKGHSIQLNTSTKPSIQIASSSIPLSITDAPPHSDLLLAQSNTSIQPVQVIRYRASVRPGYEDESDLERVGLRARGGREKAEKEREGRRLVLLSDASPSSRSSSPSQNGNGTRASSKPRPPSLLQAIPQKPKTTSFRIGKGTPPGSRPRSPELGLGIEVEKKEKEVGGSREEERREKEVRERMEREKGEREERERVEKERREEEERERVRKEEERVREEREKMEREAKEKKERERKETARLAKEKEKEKEKEVAKSKPAPTKTNGKRVLSKETISTSDEEDDSETPLASSTPKPALTKAKKPSSPPPKPSPPSEPKSKSKSPPALSSLPPVPRKRTISSTTSFVRKQKSRGSSVDSATSVGSGGKKRRVERDYSSSEEEGEEKDKDKGPIPRYLKKDKTTNGSPLRESEVLPPTKTKKITTKSYRVHVEAFKASYASYLNLYNLLQGELAAEGSGGGTFDLGEVERLCKRLERDRRRLEGEKEALRRFVEELE